MVKRLAVPVIAAVVAALGFAAVPAAQARGHFAAAPSARGAVGGHVGHFAAGSPHYGHFSAAAPHFGHFAPAAPRFGHAVARAPHFAARAFGPGRFAPGRFNGPIHAGPRFAPGVRIPRGFAGRPAPPVANFAPGVRRFGSNDEHFPLAPWHRRFWGGGYWHGLFWPRVFYGASFTWFLPLLPAYCPVYWYDQVPYYYYDDVYYVWSPQYDGYVVTDPPPVEGTGPDAQQSSAEDDSATGAVDAAAATNAEAPTYSNATSAEVFAYPERGQSEEQQQQDRSECAQWAASQTSSQGTVTVADYRRAMIACFEARGYSAR